MAVQTPQNVQHTRVSDTLNALTWTALSWSDNKVGGINVYRSVNGGSFAFLTSLAGTFSAYNDYTAKPDNRYSYRLQAFLGSTYGGTSLATAVTRNTPAAPTSPTASQIRGGSVALNARSTSNSATGYEWSRSVDGGNWSVVGTSTGTSYRDESPVVGSARYRVRAQADSLSGPYSTIVTTRVLGLPAAPTNAAHVRVSDVRNTVTWELNATANEPYEFVRLERRKNGESFVEIGSYAPTTTRIHDNSTGWDHRYEYRVRARNIVGESPYSNITTPTYNTPLAPGSITAKRSASNVIVSWVDKAQYETAYEVERSVDGATWTSLTTTLPANTRSFTDVAPPAGSLRYRVRATSADTGLSSGWVVSSAISTTSPPSAPSVSLEPTPYVQQDGSVTASWVPIHKDGSGQASAEVRWYYDDVLQATDTITGDITTATRSLDGVAAGVTVSVSIRTTGAHATPGAWSARKYVEIAPVLMMAITNVDRSFLGSMNANLEGSVAGVQNPVAGTVTDADGRVIATYEGEIQTVSGVSSWYYPGSHTEPFYGPGTYTLTLDAADAYGSRVRAEYAFMVAADPVEGLMTASAEFRQVDLSVVISVATQFAELASPYPVTEIRITRSDGELVATLPPTGGAVVDLAPPIGVDVRYTATAVTVDGRLKALDVDVATEGGAYAFSFGDEDMAILRYNVDRSQDVVPSGESVALAGSIYPRWYAGEHRAHIVQVSGDIFSDEDHDAFNRLATYGMPLLYRGPYGEMFRARAEVSMADKFGPRKTRVSIRLERLE